MLLWSLKHPAARRHREMGGTDRFPALHGFYPIIRSRAGQVRAAFETQGAGITTGCLRVLPYAGNDRFALVMQIKEGKPAVSQTRNAAHAGCWRQRRLGRELQESYATLEATVHAMAQQTYFCRADAEAAAQKLRAHPR